MKMNEEMNDDYCMRKLEKVRKLSIVSSCFILRKMSHLLELIDQCLLSALVTNLIKSGIALLLAQLELCEDLAGVELHGGKLGWQVPVDCDSDKRAQNYNMASETTLLFCIIFQVQQAVVVKGLRVHESI